ncbi:UDP-glucose/GDP-mannose dehydrogenase family protein [Candidatus Micrarchaeota archaeon]|nr:UDP-glucose/GDP-mannose dehydrogenase family protein [Candidatus Micrarchaeota archaeon]
MKISIIGTGYVGLVTGACFAELGNDVTCVDVDKKKVEMINSGKSPIFEHGLEELLKKNLGKRLRATLDAEGAVSNSEITFICVGTPPRKDGSTDLSYVEGAAKTIGRILSGKKERHIVVVKSTVPPGTTEKIAELLKAAGAKSFGVAMNPEFLREGKAVEDFMKPDRVVIGSKDEWVAEKLGALYSFSDAPKVLVETRTAEMIKYASNAFLACKLSYMNEVGNLCKKLGVDVYQVLEGMKHDLRIGGRHMAAGAGYGGSCFPKDLDSLIHTAKENGLEPVLLEAVREVNNRQPLRMVELAEKHMKLKGSTVAVLGLAFKPDTDDMREAPALRIIDVLLGTGARVVAYDPQAMQNAKKILGGRVEYAKDAKEAIRNADACFIMTEWDEFKNPSLYKGKLVVDGRKAVKLEKDYEGVCW